MLEILSLFRISTEMGNSNSTMSETSINTKLAGAVSCYCDPFAIDAGDLRCFIETDDYRIKQGLALDMIRRSIRANAKVNVWDPLEKLAELERTITNLKAGPRDHIVHAMNLFILGIYINHEIFEKDVLPSVDPFQWKLAGLFHDNAYPVDIGLMLASKYSHYLGIDFEFSSRNLGVLEKRKWFWFRENGFDLIQRRLSEWKLGIDVQRAHDQSPSCHSIVGALGLLRLLDRLYQEHNPRRVRKERFRDHVDWNEKYFEEDIVSACSAIFIHNLDASWFRGAKIDPEVAPLAFLLKLCDALQDWGRHSESDDDGISAEEYDIDIVDRMIIYRAPTDREARIRSALCESLEGIDNLIEINP